LRAAEALTASAMRALASVDMGLRVPVVFAFLGIANSWLVVVEYTVLSEDVDVFDVIFVGNLVHEFFGSDGRSFDSETLVHLTLGKYIAEAKLDFFLHKPSLKIL
jgi:hypothetical protein